MIAGTGGIRYDIFAGDVTRDDTMIVSPFRDRFYAFSGLNSDEASAVLETMQVFLPGDPRPLPFGSMVATSAPDPELVRGLSLSPPSTRLPSGHQPRHILAPSLLSPFVCVCVDG